MISIIIPTLWNSPCIHQTIESFLNSSFKKDSEIIIIDNSNSDYVSPDANYIKVIKMEQNIFVNPAWNLGVDLSENKHICLLNDDIHFNMNTFLLNFNKLIYQPNIDYGMIAIDPETFSFSEDLNIDNDILELGKVTQRGAGFGMMMILKKEYYEPISDDFKIYFGDDILWLINDTILKRKSFYFKGLKIKGQMSATSSKYESTYLQEEFKHWEKNVQKIIKKYGNG
jgi:glycosyltransferase involved in cell wall biosynthesis